MYGYSEANFVVSFPVGTIHKFKVITIDKDKQVLDLSVKALEESSKSSGGFQVGEVVIGRISRISNLSMNVQLAAHQYGRVFITDVHDVCKANPFEGIG